MWDLGGKSSFRSQNLFSCIAGLVPDEVIKSCVLWKIFITSIWELPLLVQVPPWGKSSLEHNIIAYNSGGIVSRQLIVFSGIVFPKSCIRFTLISAPFNYCTTTFSYPLLRILHSDMFNTDLLLHNTQSQDFSSTYTKYQQQYEINDTQDSLLLLWQLTLQDAYNFIISRTAALPPNTYIHVYTNHICSCAVYSINIIRVINLRHVQLRTKEPISVPTNSCNLSCLFNRTLSVIRNSTYFNLLEPPLRKPEERKLHLTNYFNFSIVIHQANLVNNAQGTFEVRNIFFTLIQHKKLSSTQTVFMVWAKEHRARFLGKCTLSYFWGFQVNFTLVQSEFYHFTCPSR